MKVIENLKNKVNKNTNLIKRGRWINLSFVFGVNEKEFISAVAQRSDSPVWKEKLLSYEIKIDGCLYRWFIYCNQRYG